MWLFETDDPLSFHYQMKSQKYAVNSYRCRNTPKFQTDGNFEIMRKFSKLESSFRFEPSKEEFETTLKLYPPQDFEEYEKFCREEEELQDPDWTGSLASISLYKKNIHAEICLSENSHDEFYKGLNFYDPKLHTLYIILDFIGFGHGRPVSEFIKGKKAFAGVSGLGFSVRDVAEPQ